MYKAGQWYVICDVCGFRHHSDEIKLRWDGLRVCKEDWEPRHPQEFGRTVNDQQTVDYARPEPDYVFVDVPYIE